MTRFGMSIALILVTGTANAQAYLECGSVACAPNSGTVYFVGAGEVTGINDLNVDGDLFDVTFTTTEPATSPFVLSSSTAAPGQPITGIDAADAISAVYGSLPPPYGGYPIAGDQGPVIITSFGPAGSLSEEFTQFGEQPVTELYDAAQTNVGVDYHNDAEVGTPGSFALLRTASGSSPINAVANEVAYTIWTPIAAPEVDLNSAASGVALLLGGLAVLRGRKQRWLLH